jgi:A/G-specific adenine glycosylase
MTGRKHDQSDPGENSTGTEGAWTVNAMLAWYDRARRDLPWRAPPGGRTDPYRVWLSEIMLQQTTIKAVAPYYTEFLRRWPRVEVLAAAGLDEVLSAWAGLGYYARARNLHACAQVVASEHAGVFPDTEAELLKLPGIGPYTAAAIAAIAFERRAAVVDGNVERVLARFYGVETPLPAGKPQLREYARELAPAARPGDFAQAMMDLGATVCTPRSPTCSRCPLKSNCVGRSRGLREVLPYKAPKKERPTRRGMVYFVRHGDEVLLRRRPDKGLLGGMAEVPGSPWAEGRDSGDDPLAHAPVSGKWSKVPGLVEHTFTHFRLELSVYHTTLGKELEIFDAARPHDCFWVDRHDLDDQALPSVMRKVISHALAD